jgi:hypothetical protein
LLLKGGADLEVLLEGEDEGAAYLFVCTFCLLAGMTQRCDVQSIKFNSFHSICIVYLPQRICCAALLCSAPYDLVDCRC